MTTVDRMTQLLTALRQELGGQIRTKRTDRSGQTEAATSDEISQSVSPEALKSRISRELKRYNLKSTESRKHARRLFVETIILGDLGGDISQDPQFSFLIRDVETSLSEDPKISQALDNLLEELQRQ